MSENFEQQVKRILDDVQLEPRAEVWNNVNQTMGEKKKHWRIIFWWILPVLVTAGSVIYFLPGNSNKKIYSVADKKNTTSTDLPRGSATTLPEVNNASNNEQLISDMQIVRSDAKQAMRYAVITTKPGQFANRSSNHQKKNTKEKNDAVIAPGQMITSAADSRKDQPVVKHDADTSQKDTAIAAAKPSSRVSQMVDSPQVSFNTPKDEKHSKKSKWSLGISTDVGFTSVTEGALFGFGKEKTMDVVFSNPSGPLGSLASFTYQRTTFSSRLSAAFYFTAHKQLNSSVAFRSSLGFRHQSFSIKTSTIKDSLMAGSFVSLPVQRLTSDYKFNYINLYTGVSFKLVRVNELKLSLGAGIDNQLLLAGKKAKRNESLLFSQAITEDRSSSLNAYHIWQPLFRVELAADFSSHKKQWLQLSPYLNYGFRSFEKQPGAASQRLASFGLTGTYFFR